MKIDIPTSSQRHVAFLLRPLLLGSKAASWFALTTVRLDYLCSLEAEELPIIKDMVATHHFHGHNRPLPLVQILNDGSFFSFG
jgi:hypothetical protein